MKKTLHIIKKTLHIKLTIIVLLLLPLVAFTLLTSKTDKLLGIQSFVVLTGSMQPTIPQGSIVYTKASQIYKPGDVVAFQDGNVTVTHRIKQMVERDGAVFFETKGDANNAIDSSLVAKEDILGKAENRIPYVGNFILFLKTIPGFIALIIVPGALFVAFELWNIKQEIVRKTEERMKRQLIVG